MTAEAKTCAKCGEAKALDQFTKDRRKASGRSAECYVCKRERSRARNADPKVREQAHQRYRQRMTDPVKRELKRQQGRDAMRRAKAVNPEKIRTTGAVSRQRQQDHSLETATRRGFPWTGPELELLARTGLTPAQLAEMTGRTVYAVRMMRKKARTDPRYVNLAGVGQP